MSGRELFFQKVENDSYPMSGIAHSWGSAILTPRRLTHKEETDVQRQTSTKEWNSEPASEICRTWHIRIRSVFHPPSTRSRKPDARSSSRSANICGNNPAGSLSHSGLDSSGTCRPHPFRTTRDPPLWLSGRPILRLSGSGCTSGDDGGTAFIG